MDGITLMIVDNSEEFRLALDSALSDAYSIYHCSNGRQALEEALKRKPDVMILDLMLTELDVVTLLHEIRNAGLRPMVLVVTRFFNDYVLESAQELGIGYIIRKPCDPAAVSQRVRDLSKRLNPKSVKPCNSSLYVAEQIKRLQFSPRHKGFEYLKEAAIIMYQQPDISITKELYPTIGSKYGCSAQQVERSIRCAINFAWSQNAGTAWAELSLPAPGGNASRPSNGTLISRLADDLRKKLAEEA